MGNTNFRVVNLANLFWDNGSYKYPNTYPRLVHGTNPNKTPVMTGPTTGWVVLEGDWNYCEFNGELFFLKKNRVISHTRNKWVYVLVKDHICTIFKKWDGVTASGTLINTNLSQLTDNDFQYTFPVFNNYTQRILVPLKEEPFNWRTHSKFQRITKRFEDVYPITDVEFSILVSTLEANRDLLTKNPTKEWSEQVNKNKHLVLLGRLGRSKKKVKNWKQELVDKINELIDTLPASSEIVMGVVDNTQFRNATKINGRLAISYLDNNPFFKSIEENKELEVDLTGLTDIELINFDITSKTEKYSRDYFNLFFKYDINKVPVSSREDDESRLFIQKLSRRVRLPFLHKNTTRAIYKTSGQHYSYVWDYQGLMKYPQKILFKLSDEQKLRVKDKYRLKYPKERTGDIYRSVYLYWVSNWNFYFVWGWGSRWSRIYSYQNSKNIWLTGKDYFTSDKNVLLSISNEQEQYVINNDSNGLVVIPSTHNRNGEIYELKEEYENKFPWKELKQERINLGWLLGQFSIYIDNQSGYFEEEFPFIIKSGVLSGTKLKRLKGFNNSVANLLHLQDIYDIDSLNLRSDYTLDCFSPLSRRMREKTKEEDFLIGEKLLFTTWGFAPYLLFQPTCPTTSNVSVSGDIVTIWDTIFSESSSGRNWKSFYGYYNWADVDEYNTSNYQLFGKWIEYASWHYPYVVFDQGSYFKQEAKNWYKKANENYEVLTPYKRFYSSDENYRELKKNIVNNTKAYFVTDEVDFTKNEIKELKVNDIFFSSEEWFWFNASEGKNFTDFTVSDFLVHTNSVDMYGENKLTNQELVVYLNPKDKKIYFGQTYVWKSEMKLPTNQYISENLDSDSSTKDSIEIEYTRISPATTDIVSRELTGFDSINTLIDSLKSERFIKKTMPENLKELQDTGRDYLFNLKGTPFFCAFDRKGKVSLIFKNKESYDKAEHIPD